VGSTVAWERGVAFGRPTKLNPKQRRMIAERDAAGEAAVALNGWLIPWEA
jgi:hypothetical protein